MSLKHLISLRRRKRAQFLVPPGQRWYAIGDIHGCYDLLNRLIGQIDADRKAGMTPRQAVIEATVRRSRPVVLTAAAALLAFIPLTLSSFWGPMAFTLIGGVGVGTVLTLLFLPALYALFFGVERGGLGRQGPDEGGAITIHG